MANDGIEQKNAAFSLRLLNEQHELILSQEREILGLKVDLVVARERTNKYKDRIIELELSGPQKLHRKLLRGWNHEKTIAGSTATP